MPLRSRGGHVVYGGSQLPDDAKRKADALIDEFEHYVESELQQRGLPPAVCRTAVPCIVYVLLNKFSVFILFQASDVITSTLYMPIQEVDYGADDIIRAGRWQWGLKDPVAVRFASDILEQPSSSPTRVETVKSVALQFVELEVQRMLKETQQMIISPIFGSPSFRVEERQCFVLMPFNDELNGVYRNFIRPTVEAKNLVCKRADEIRGTQTIIRDIWKGICESRFIIADITGRNPNVFYELGIAHTVGKPTILLMQEDETRPPFDISHIRQIRYANNSNGLPRLTSELAETIDALLAPVVIEGDTPNIGQHQH